MNKKIFFLVAVGMLIYSCSDTVILPENSLEIDGYWINEEVNDSISTFHRSDSLDDNQYCFGFLNNGKFVERKNAGWCGTPPIAYSDYEGEWSVQDSLIHISVPYWGGMANYTWKLVRIDTESFSYYIVNAQFE